MFNMYNLIDINLNIKEEEVKCTEKSVHAKLMN